MPLDRELDKGIIKLKTWWKSATVWIQGVVVAIAAFWDMLPGLGPLLPANDSWTTRGIMIASAFASLYVRIFRTNQAVTLSAAEKPVAEDKVISK